MDRKLSLSGKRGYVKAQLQTRLKRKKDETDGSSNSKWRELHTEVLQADETAFRSCFPSDKIRASGWYPLCGNRETMALAKALMDAPKAPSVDICQSINRVMLGSDGQVSTCVPGSFAWMVVWNRILLGLQAMSIQGFDMEWLLLVCEKFGISDNLLKDLAGNAFSCQIICAIVIALLLHFPFASCDAHMSFCSSAEKRQSAESATSAFDTLFNSEH